MTTAAEQTIAPRTVNSSTSRVRRHRELRRDGLRLFTVTVPETVSENAIARGLLAAGSRQAVVSDPGLLRRAGFGRGSQLAHQWRALRVTHGQFRTHAPQQTASLFDHLVGARQQGGRSKLKKSASLISINAHCRRSPIFELVRVATGGTAMRLDAIFSTTIALAVFTVLWGADTAHAQQPTKGTPARATWGAPEGAKCLQCHKAMNPALTQEWHESAHGQKGINCYDCHKANKNNPGAFEHNGSVIHVVVSPKDCGGCHQKEMDQQKGSHHAKAGEILASLDNFLGSVLGGPPAVAVGCFQCHGSTIKVLPGGKFDPATWPNTGIGRINPDGSAGSCSACHTRHRFSKAQAREPQTCGKCHLGPDHPQIEVYQESKHGILWEANKLRLNLEKDPWRPGVEYSAAPSCATCHMSATRTQGVTHDVGERISWTLRPAVSTKLNMIVFDDLSKEDRPDGAALPKVGDEVKGRDGVTRKVQQILTWQQRRERMQDVCTGCHANGQVAGFYQQFDDLVGLYNDKFGKPAAAIMAELYKANKLTPAPMDEKLEWIYYELWHHEGRRARHGASMSGPDYAWWHGIYEVAKSFYMEFLPEMKRVAGEPLASELMEKYVYAQPGHLWLKEGMTKEQLQKIEEFYRNRYGEQGDKK